MNNMSQQFSSLSLDNSSAVPNCTKSMMQLGNGDSSESIYTSNRYDSTSSDDDDLSPAYSQLFNAITNGNLAMVKQMLDFGLNVNYIYDKEQKYSFLHLACLMGYSKIIKYLLDRGANVNYVTSDGLTPLDFVHSDDINTISYMLVKMSGK